MCHNPDEGYLKDLLDYYKETVHLLGNRKKSARERMVCRAFLRCAEIPFTEEEIKASDHEPPDVLFDSARFEVMMVLDEDRKLHGEWKGEVKRVEKAKSIDDVLLPPPSPKSIRLAELVPLITDRLKNKFEGYSNRNDIDNCGNLDALVYVNLRQTYFVPTSPGVYSEDFNTENLDIQGWRSVSVVMVFSRTENLDIQNWPSLHVVVLTATPTAPSFIRERVGKILNACPYQERVFEP